MYMVGSKFSAIPWNLGPPDQESMENWSPGPKFHGKLVPRTKIPRKIVYSVVLAVQSNGQNNPISTVGIFGTLPGVS